MTAYLGSGGEAWEKERGSKGGAGRGWWEIRGYAEKSAAVKRRREEARGQRGEMCSADGRGGARMRGEEMHSRHHSSAAHRHKPGGERGEVRELETRAISRARAARGGGCYLSRVGLAFSLVWSS